MPNSHPRFDIKDPSHAIRSQTKYPPHFSIVQRRKLTNLIVLNPYVEVDLGKILSKLHHKIKYKGLADS